MAESMSDTLQPALEGSGDPDCPPKKGLGQYLGLVFGSCIAYPQWPLAFDDIEKGTGTHDLSYLQLNLLRLSCPTFSPNERS